MDFLTAAFELCAFGWKVFPVAPFAKIPAIPKNRGGRGCLDASDDEEIIAGWAVKYPRANIGIACGEPSGIIVVDFDPRNGSNDTIARLAVKKRTFSPTVEVRTWSGGTHLYYRWQPGIINSKSRLGRGIDIKTTGGYVVAPPSSVHQDGAKGEYAWIRSPLGGDLPRLPQWAVEALKPKPEPIRTVQKVNGPKDFNSIFRYIQHAPQGQRNNILYWGACRAAEAGVSDAKSALISAAMSVGLPHKEAEKTVECAFRRLGKL